MEHTGNNHDCLSELSAFETSLNSHIGEPVVVLIGDDLIENAIAMTGVNLGYSGDKKAPMHVYDHTYELEHSYKPDQNNMVLLGYDEVIAYVDNLLDHYRTHGSLRSLIMALWVAYGDRNIFGSLDTSLVDEAKNILRTGNIHQSEAYDIFEALLSAPEAIQAPLIAVVEERLRNYVYKNGILAIKHDGLSAGYLEFLHDSGGNHHSDATAIARILSQ